MPAHEAQVRAAVPLAAGWVLPVVATHPIQFLTPEDFEAHEARICVAEGETLTNPKRIKRFSREQYFKTGADGGAVRRHPLGHRQLGADRQRCNLTLLGKPQLPNFPTPLVDGAPTS